jgi:hypothetical protein
MLNEHLVLTKAEAVARLTGNYTGDIATFDQIHKHANGMSDAIVAGILISDATSSGMKKHYETTLERVHDYYGLVMDLGSLKKMLNVFESVSKGEMEIPHERMSEFLEKHNLLDLRSMEKVKI